MYIRDSLITNDGGRRRDHDVETRGDKNFESEKYSAHRLRRLTSMRSNCRGGPAAIDGLSDEGVVEEEEEEAAISTRTRISPPS